MARVMVVASYAGSLVGFRSELMAAMVASGHDVVACAPREGSDIQSQLNNIGVRYQDITLHRTGMDPFQDLRSLCSLVSLFRTLQPDVVLSYTIKPVIYGSIGAAIAGVDKICSMVTGLGYTFSRETFKQKLVGFIARGLYRTALRFNKVVFFQNPDDLSLFRELGLVKNGSCPTLINGSGVNLEYYSPRPLPASPSFLLVARLIVEKGICEYAEAARILKQKYPSVSFRLVGEIDVNPSAIPSDQLQAWIDDGVIDYLGKLDDVRPAIEASSVYVLPSYREGVPRSVLEAMSMGRAVITTDTPGCRETVVDAANGLLVPPKDATSLAQAMETFIIDPGLAATMGRQSRLLAEERFDVHKVNHVILSRLGLRQGLE